MGSVRVGGCAEDQDSCLRSQSPPLLSLPLRPYPDAVKHVCVAVAVCMGAQGAFTQVGDFITKETGNNNTDVVLGGLQSGDLLALHFLCVYVSVCE